MSVVTDVILITNILDDDCPAIPKINEWLMKNYGAELKRVDEIAGGNKYFQANVYMGAFNHFNTDNFIIIVNEQNWESREFIQILIKEEHENIFSLLTLGNK